MENNRQEQIEALETLKEFNKKIIKNIPILKRELLGQRLDDTKQFMNSIVNAINWEIEVLNQTMDVLNDGKERISKDAVNTKITILSEAINSKDDGRIAAAFENLLPALESLQAAVEEVTA